MAVFNGLLLAFGFVTACAKEPSTIADTPRIGPVTPRDPARLPEEQQAAIAALAASASPEGPTEPAGHGSHTVGEPDFTVPLPPAQAQDFKAEWADAVAAVPALDTPQEAAAAGYTRAAVQGAGVGVHWVNWMLIDAPFDPAQPSMLLFDERKGRQELFGFSYWVRGAAPEGFAGPNDHWHQHSNLCIVNGWVDRESVAGPGDCAGHLLAGADLWMLHAWVVPGHENRWGQFATRHPALCPGPGDALPDISRCPTSS